MATATMTAHETWQDAVEQAVFAGMEAAEFARPIPMVVGTPANMMGSLTGGDDGGFRTDRPTYFVEGGVCGFAWVQVKGSMKFRNWLLGRVKTKSPASAALGTMDRLLSEPRPDSYYGGVSLSVFGYGQSMQRKEAFGRAFAAKLNSLAPEAGAYCMSRMD